LKDFLSNFITIYKKRGVKIKTNPIGFRKIKLSVDIKIFRGFSAKSMIKKYKKAAIPNIRKKKSALITHNKIKIKKMKRIDS